VVLNWNEGKFFEVPEEHKSTLLPHETNISVFFRFMAVFFASFAGVSF